MPETDHNPPPRARALHRYPESLSPGRPDAERRPYVLSLGVHGVVSDSASCAYDLTEEEADDWAADVADLLSACEEGARVWFRDPDGDRIVVAVDDLVFLNVNDRAPGAAPEAAEDQVAADLSELYDGMRSALPPQPGAADDS